MDGESSYESDISESWSLIDININEDSLSVTETLRSPTSELKNEKPGKGDKLEIEDFVRKCKETNKAEFSRVSDSQNGSLFKSQESCSRTEDSENFLSKKNFSDDGANDSGDSESIEILEIDGNYRDSELDRLGDSSFDQLDVSTYQSDDEESLEGKNNIENRSNNSTVIRRRRKRLSRSPEDAVHSVNSENKSVKKKVEDCTGVNEISEASSRGNSSPVYKHYRNNVVNTVLSLSVGVIFAGVACLAIGHFLGVQDASEAAVELTDTLKKLQAENAALQSALINLERNSKSELPLTQPQEAPPTEQPPQVEPSKTQIRDLNKAELPAVRSKLNSIEWLSKLQGFIRKNNKVNERESRVDLNRLGKYILDQVHSLNRKMEEGAKFFEDADKKISRYLQRIIKRLSSSQDDIEILHERLIKLKNTLSNKLDRVTSYDEIQRVGKARRRVPVTELELQTMHWRPERRIDKSFQEDYRKSILLCNFPQPEKYYKNNSIDKELAVTNETVRNEKEENKKHKNETKEEKKKAKKQMKREKREKRREKRERKGGKKQKWAVNQFEKLLKNVEKSRRKDKSGRLTLNEVALNLANPQTKKCAKSGEKGSKHKQKCKKSKHSKPKKVSPANLKKESLKKKQYSRFCSGPQCFNLTGHWVFKWADGREEFRRHQAVGEWQFDRAKARKELRDYNYDENWQFKRAVAREYTRWNRGKYEKYFGKDFFHEKFSWI